MLSQAKSLNINSFRRSYPRCRKGEGPLSKPKEFKGTVSPSDVRDKPRLRLFEESSYTYGM